MTRSRRRKLQRTQLSRRTRAVVTGVPLASAVLAVINPAMAQAPQQATSPLEELVVTAQKREESLQNVPLSIQAIGSAKLEELHINDFDDYVKYLPSVSYQTFGPGFSLVYMRGVASGGDGNHSASLPSVGMYLDEQPITTASGNLDVHLYDIARVEALAGPQGTLFGASSQAGTIRIITNKPDASAFSAGYDVEGNLVNDGDTGYVVEGFVNIPLSDNAAIRLVGWGKRDAGFIDNVAGTRTFPTSGVLPDGTPVPLSGACIANVSPPPPGCETIRDGSAEDDYNDVETYGGRVALKLDLNDNWSISPTLMGQEAKAHGSFGFDSTVGELQVRHFYPEESKDRFYQAALTVAGSFSNLDMVYAGSYLDRDVDSESDYSDYSFWYDQCCAYGYYMYDNNGTLINPSQYIQGKDRYEMQSHELRFSSPSDQRVRFVGGLYYQKMEHRIEQRYLVDNLTDQFEVTLWPDTIWLTEQVRTNRDSAVFGEVSFDVTDKFTVTGGGRYFEAKNSLEGFFGFGGGFSGSTGESQCFDPNPFNGAPCRNLDKSVDESGSIFKINLAYRFDADRMAYVTWSEGFRPGGINRRGTLPPYLSDFLTNYEAGWKTTWADGRFRFNGAIFLEQWEDFQFAILGANGLTEINNAAQAEIRGVEADITWAATDGLTISGGVAYLQSELTEPFCGFVDANGNPVAQDPCPTGLPPPDDFVAPEAPDGTELPVTPEFKGNLTARLEFPMGTFGAHLQGSVIYTGERESDLRLVERAIIGTQPSYTVADFSFGIENDNFSLELFINNAFDERAQVYRYAQCAEAVCGAETYTIANQPQTYGLKFGQKF